MASGNFSARSNFRLDFNVGQGAQEISNNRSRLDGELWIVNTGGYRSSSGAGGQTWWFSIAGQTGSGTFTFNLGPGESMRLWAGSVWIPHEADGTRHVAFTSHVEADVIGVADAGSNFWLTQIPRASKATIEPSPDNLQPGTACTIRTNRASTAFDHSVQWYWGQRNGAIAGGVLDTVSWTPPWDFLNELANATTGTGAILTGTWQNGQLLGTTTTAFRVNVPASVVPVIDSITVYDDNPTVRSAIGAFVQGESLLKTTVAASGVYSSTITARQFTVDGQTAASGATVSLPYAGTRAVGAAATDSRGRTGTSAANISVLAYAPPTIDALVRRATSAGAVNDDIGAYLRVDLNASVSSLVVSGSQKNTLGIRAWTRERNASAWTERNVIAPTALTYSGNFLISGGGIFDITKAYEVRIAISDKLRTVTWDTTVATADILMDWTADGVGVKKYRERGALDVGGDTYTSGEVRVGSQFTVPVPIGGGLEWFGPTLPAGFAWQDGSAVSRTTYAALFAQIGTLYGPGNGSTTFNLPNKNGRAGVGYDASQTEFNTLGKVGGAKTHTLTNDESPSHAHGALAAAVGSGWRVGTGDNAGAGAGQVGVTNASTGATGGGGPHNNLQPYLTQRYIIRII